MAELVGLSLKNVRRLEVKFDPFHPNAANVREFYQGATSKKPLKTNPECLFKAQIVCDRSDPLVTVQYQDNYKMVINSKDLESNEIVKIIKQEESLHREQEEV